MMSACRRPVRCRFRFYLSILTSSRLRTGESCTNGFSNINDLDDTSVAFSAVSEALKRDTEQSEKPKPEYRDASNKPENEPAASPDLNEKDNSSKPSKKSTDPLRWFGILVPPALRSAQQSFISVVEGPIPQIANIARELRSQEIEIGRVRKQIKKL